MFEEAHFQNLRKWWSNFDSSIKRIRLNRLVLFGIWFSALEKPVRHSKRRIPQPRSKRTDYQGRSLYMLALEERYPKPNIQVILFNHPFQRDSFLRLNWAGWFYRNKLGDRVHGTNRDHERLSSQEATTIVDSTPPTIAV